MNDKVVNEGFKAGKDEPDNSSSSSFRGNFNHNLDDKGRVSLPSEFRKVLKKNQEKSVVLTNYISDGSRCIEGFSLKAWDDFELLEMKGGEVIETAKPNLDETPPLINNIEADEPLRSGDSAKLEAPLLLENLEANPIETRDLEQDVLKKQ